MTEVTAMLYIAGALMMGLGGWEVREGESSEPVRLSPEPEEQLGSLLNRLNIPLDDIFSIFYNSKLLAARSRMASWIGYQQVRSNPFDWDLNIAVQSSDRIGIFGRDMAALVV